MERESLAQVIKDTRKKYQLSQRAFAALLGIGEATIVRYEAGTVPSRANANLILAAADPHFMQGCLERNGDCITDKQRKSTREVIYAYINIADLLGEGEEKMSIDEMYHYTLRQEVLNEQAAEIVCSIIQYLSEEGVSPDQKNHPLVVMADHLFELKKFIVSVESRDDQTLDEIAGHLRYLKSYMNELMDTRGAA